MIEPITRHSCRVEVLKGPDIGHSTNIMSWWPLKLHIIISHWRFAELDKLLQSQVVRKDSAGISYAEYERDRLMRTLITEAALAVQDKLQRARTFADRLLTAAFVASALLYPLSISYGVTVDAFLLSSLFIVARVHISRDDYVSKLINGSLRPRGRNGGDRHG